MQLDTHDKSLKVLNASAGSGKTYSLVKEYIKLLIEDPSQTKRFNQIIAMTFTNMAALEMKTRIISSLDVLSNPMLYKGKADELATKISLEITLSKDEIFQRSKIVMKQMLHSYEDFSVMTIDKFNLRLIRSFSRDLDLPADFEVVLNENQVIEQVVDLLMSSLGTEEMKEFTRTVFNYSKENLEEGEGWDFRRSLIAFGSTFNKEKDQRYLELIVAEDFNEQKMTEVRLKIKKMEDQHLSLALKADTIVKNAPINPKDFPGGSRFSQRIEKCATGWKNDLEPFSDTLKATLVNETPKGKFFPDDLRNILVELDEYKDAFISSYQTLLSFAKNFYNMSLLKFLAEAIEKMKKDERIIRISEFNKLISSLVRDEEAPFIYERLGNRYQHFLLDEFQDTSRLQWMNMVPLVHESIAQQKFNLIVGDPKQSIYRFKNGVAEQFVALPGIYNPEKDPSIEQKSNYFREAGYVDELKSNWRSSPEIVSFNNELFVLLRERLSSSSQLFYNSIIQHSESKNAGFVKIESGQYSDETKEQIKRSILEIVDQCIVDNFKKSDICILAETNAIANEWSIILKEAGHKIISAESLLIDNDLRVNLTISYLKRRLKPATLSEIKRFAEIYFRSQDAFSFKSYSSYLKKGTNKEGKVYTYFDNEAFIVDQFGSTEHFFFNYENIYDLVQGFYKLMGWNELKDPYLHHLADFVYDFEQNRGPDLSGIIDVYQEKKKILAIQTPPSDDAIIVMTIHKSKGLEFPVVILPNCDFDTSIKVRSKFLVESGDYILHTTLSASTKIEAIKKMHEEESEQVLTDKMNLCYVAFTRPELRLYAFNYFKDKNFGIILHQGLIQIDHQQNEDGSITVSKGTLTNKEHDQKKSSQFFEPLNVSDRLWFPDIAFTKKTDLTEPTGLSDEQRFGSQFHLLMAELNSAEELDVKLDSLLLEGSVDVQFKDMLKERIEDVFKDPAYNQLFTDALDYMNEQGIIIDEENSKRPDKVILKKDQTIILDYKTGIQKPSDFKQMKEYIQLLQEMSFPDVSGYLYYTSNNELIPIT